jgi:uncharacterized protein (DUF2345 family)
MAAIAEVPVELGNDSQTSQANTTDSQAKQTPQTAKRRLGSKHHRQPSQANTTNSEEKARMEHARWIYANNILFLEPLLAR